MFRGIDQELKFGRYGDFGFLGSDFDVITNNNDIAYQNVLDRLISNLGDYSMYSEYGADLSSNIGRNNNARLESEIKERISYSLTNDGFMSPVDFMVSTMRSNEKILIRIDVLGNTPVIEDSFRVNAIYNTSSGMTYATN